MGSFFNSDNQPNGSQPLGSKTRMLKQLDVPTQEQNKSIAIIYIEQAQVYCKERNWQKAILACRNALEIYPNLADAYRIIGNILCHQGQFAEALGIYAKALTINPNMATLYADIGDLYVEQKDWQKALKYYQQAVVIDPNLAEVYRSLAQVWEELGETERAFECFFQAINLDPTVLKAEDYFSLGRELYQQKKLKEASILFAHGVKLNPFAEAELVQLVQILEELEEWQQAVAYYHQLMSLPDGENNTYLESSNQELQRDKPIKKLFSHSQSSFNKVISKDTKSGISALPTNVVQQLLPAATTKFEKQKLDSALSWNNLGSIYAQKKEWTKAINCYQEALQLDPNFAKSYRNLARIYHQQEEELKAALYWHEAFSIEPDLVKPEEYFNLAQKLLKYQQKEKAIACLQRVVEQNPHFNNAQAILERLTN